VAQNEADIQELPEDEEALRRRVEVFMLAYVEWNIIGSIREPCTWKLWHPVEYLSDKF
jgi:hypothetical protein